MNHNGTRSYQFQVSYHLSLVLSSGFFPSFFPTRTYNSVCLSHILTTYPVSLIYPGCSSSCRRSETMSLNCDHQRAYFSSLRWYMMWRVTVEWYLLVNQRTVRITYPSANLSITNPTWTEPGATRACAVWGRRLTTRIMDTILLSGLIYLVNFVHLINSARHISWILVYFAMSKFQLYGMLFSSCDDGVTALLERTVHIQFSSDSWVGFE
jgi:hypothetical protein